MQRSRSRRGAPRSRAAPYSFSSFCFLFLALIDSVDTQYAGHLHRTLPDGAGHILIAGHLAEQGAGEIATVVAQIGDRDEFAGTAEPGIALHGKRAKAIDHDIGRERVELR